MQFRKNSKNNSNLSNEYYQDYNEGSWTDYIEKKENERNTEIPPAFSRPKNDCMDEKEFKKAKKRKRRITIIVVIIGLMIINSIGNKISERNERRETINSTLNWPSDSKLASMLPEGKIENDNATYFSAKVYKTSQEDFNDYVKACKKKGFKVDYDSSDDSYDAENKKGYELSLDYNWDNLDDMSITLSVPKKKNEKKSNSNASSEFEKAEVSKNDTKKVETTETNTNTSTTVTPEFKEAMDSYEAFFDEYIAFMTTYKDEDEPVSMLSDYMNYLTKYQETMEKLDQIDKDNLSAADDAYYIEVQSRINQKLTNAALDES